MPNYKKMYFALFNAVTDAMDTLREAQQEGEDIYVEEGCKELAALRRAEELGIKSKGSGSN